jgi:hypothetical protein
MIEGMKNIDIRWFRSEQGKRQYFMLHEKMLDHFPVDCFLNKAPHFEDNSKMERVRVFTTRGVRDALHMPKEAEPWQPIALMLLHVQKYQMENRQYLRQSAVYDDLINSSVKKEKMSVCILATQMFITMKLFDVVKNPAGYVKYTLPLLAHDPILSMLISPQHFTRMAGIVSVLFGAYTCADRLKSSLIPISETRNFMRFLCYYDKDDSGKRLSGKNGIIF